MKAKHSPGEWFVDPTIRQGFGGGTLPYQVIVTGGCETIHVSGNGRFTSGADARLVAAAPRLLEASRRALEYMRLHKYADRAWADDLEAAIKAAEGE